MLRNGVLKKAANMIFGYTTETVRTIPNILRINFS